MAQAGTAGNAPPERRALLTRELAGELAGELTGEPAGTSAPAAGLVAVTSEEELREVVGQPAPHAREKVRTRCARWTGSGWRTRRSV